MTAAQIEDGTTRGDIDCPIVHRSNANNRTATGNEILGNRIPDHCRVIHHIASVRVCDAYFPLLTQPLSEVSILATQ
jgi:hypothetical protein